MQRNECKPGTEIIIRGIIKKDDGTHIDPIIVTIHGDEQQEEEICFDPSFLNPAPPKEKYDPARKFRKGDLVRITGFHGRFFGASRRLKLVERNLIGSQTVLDSDEDSGGDVWLQDGILEDGCNYISVACIELVKPIEEIKAEQPYKIKEEPFWFRVHKEGSYIYEIWWKSDNCTESPYSNEEARKKAQEICDELNRKHRESLNA